MADPPAMEEMPREGETVQDQQLRMAAEVGQMLLAQNNNLKAAQAESDAEITRLKEHVSRSDGELGRSKEQVEFLRKSVHELEKALKLSQKEAEHERSKTRTLKADMVEMKDELGNEDGEKDELRAVISQLEAREKAVQTKLHDALQQAQEAAAHSKAGNQERQFLERRCSAAEKRSESLKTQLVSCKEQLRQSLEEGDSRQQSLETIMASPGVSKVLSQMTREKKQLEETVMLLRDELETLRLELRGVYEMSSASMSMSTTPQHKSLLEDMYTPKPPGHSTPVVPAFASVQNTPIQREVGMMVGQHARGMSPAMAAARLGMSPAICSFVGSTQALRDESTSPSPAATAQESADREYFLMTLTCLNCVAAEADMHICPSNVGELLWQEVQEHHIEIHRWHSYLNNRIQSLGSQGILENELIALRDRSPSLGEPPAFLLEDMHREFQAGAAPEDDKVAQAAEEMFQEMLREKQESDPSKQLRTPQQSRVAALRDEDTPGSSTGASPFLCA